MNRKNVELTDWVLGMLAVVAAQRVQIAQGIWRF
jgi:hypothetical protein